MTSSITEYTDEPLRQISEPECFINMPDRQARKSECVIHRTVVHTLEWEFRIYDLMHARHFTI